MLTKLYNKNDNDTNGQVRLDKVHQNESAEDENCGQHWTNNWNTDAKFAARLVRCGKCDECKQWKATQTQKRVLRRLEIRKDGNDGLVISSVLGVPEIKVMALQKRIQRDETAQYYRAINEAGDFDFIVQSEKVYGEVVETLEYDFALAAQTSKEAGKRQTGLLYSLKSKKVTAKKDTYPFSLTRITAEKPGDSKRITIIAKTMKPDKHVYNKKDHQAGIFALTTRLTVALDEAGIGYRTEGFSVRAGPINRDRYNSKVECPNQSPIETDVLIGAPSGQNSLFDEPEVRPAPIIWQFETTQYEDAQRQIELIGYPSN